MLYLAIYVAFCVLGALLGRYLKSKGKSLKFSSYVQTFFLILLLFIMGAKLGSNEEVIQKLGSLGITSLVFTIFVILGSIVFVLIARKLLRINKVGDSND